MQIKELEQQYKALLSDERYDQLMLRIQEPNIFRILGVSEYEIRHSNFLGWLLNPNESHGLHDLFLQRFLQDILIDDRAENISIIELGNLNVSEVEIRREWKNIDILIVTEKFVVCIENKLWSGESEGQLIKYKTVIEASFPDKKMCFVFLNPTGFEASESSSYIAYSYPRIAELLKAILKSRQEILNPSITLYLKDYLTILKQNVMSDDSTNDWAKKLYNNHREFFDFVYANKPDIWFDFSEILNKKVIDKGWILGSKNKGIVRFITPKIKDLILYYKKANGWPNKEAFLFELHFDSKTRLTFKTIISQPVDYFDYDNKIKEILSELEGANKKLGSKWKCHFIEGLNWDFPKVMMNWDETDTYEKKLDKFLTQIEPIVEKVEIKLLEHKEELLKLKEGINHI